MNNNLEFENTDPSPDSVEDNHPRTNYGERFSKQETLEEAAEKYIEEYMWEEEQDPWFDFMEGAKWQADRMYSEEEMLQALNIGFTSTDETWEECVEFAKEQFKKK